MLRDHLAALRLSTLTLCTCSDARDDDYEER